MERETIIFITEKPSVAREYCKVLGVQVQGHSDGYVEGYSSYIGANVIITWAFGHLVSICSPQEQNEEWGTWDFCHLPMIPQKFKYKIIEDKENRYVKQFNTVKNLYLRNDIKAIYYAGDSGREGIYIQALIRNKIFGGQAPNNIDEKVVWIDSFTESEIKKGIQQAKSYTNYLNMIYSGYARASTDWLIGMNFSRGLSIASGAKMIVGRVVTPTLAMIINRQKQIDNFVKTYYYGVKALLANNGEANWEACEGSRFYKSPDLYNESGFLRKQDVDKLIAEFNADRKLFIEDVKQQKKSEYAPLLFNQTDLQAFCAKNFKFAPTQTLAIAQKLYEAKLTTYPRTSARVISTAVAADLKQRKNFDIPKKYVDDSKIVDHYAIIPTFEGNASALSADEKKVYDAIMKRFMDTMKPPYEYVSVTVVYRHSNKEFFFGKFKNVIQEGWKELTPEQKIVKPIPQKNVVVDVSNFEIRNMETTPPVPYTTGTLVEDMERAGRYIDDEELRSQIKSCGIGTDATRAEIVQKLIDCQYITVDSKQKVTPTDMGKAVINITEKIDEQLVSPIKTADLETNLSAIADGEMRYGDFMNNIAQYVAKTIEKVKSTEIPKLGNSNSSREAIGTCPKCGSNVCQGKFGYYCTGKCGMIISKIFGQELTETQLKKLLSGKSVKIKYKKNGNSRDIEVFPEAVQSDFVNKETNAPYFVWKTGINTSAPPASGKKHNCPCCGSEIETARFGWKCNCGFSFGYEICSHKMLESDLEDIISNGETNVYPFVSKNGKQFIAKLVLDKENKKTQFQFAN